VNQVTVEHFNAQTSLSLEVRTADPNVGGFRFQGFMLNGSQDSSGMWTVYQVPSALCAAGGGQFEVFGVRDSVGISIWRL